MNTIFYCYNEHTKNLDKLLDSLLILMIIGWFTVVFFDWQYWKAAPYSIHSHIIHAIVYSMLFLRYCKGLDFKKALQELNFWPRLIVAFLAAVNAIFCNIAFILCRKNYPGFLRTPYLILTIFVILAGYVQLAYFCYAILKMYVLPRSKMNHHEMEDEEEEENNQDKEFDRDNPLKGHLKEQKDKQILEEDDSK